MEHELEATEAQALDAIRQALQVGTLPVDPPGWFTISQIADGRCSESTLRRALRARVASGEFEKMTAIKLINGTRVRTSVYRKSTGHQ